MESGNSHVGMNGLPLTPGESAPAKAAAMPAERLTTLLAVYTQLTGDALGYHTIVINVNVMCLSVNTLLVGYLIGNSSAVHAVSNEALALIPAVLACTGIVVTIAIRAHYMSIAAIVRRIDFMLGSFTEDFFAPGAALYPPHWRDYGTRRWHSIVFEIFIPLQLLMGVIGVTLVALR
jgi:hypothetical protein